MIRTLSYRTTKLDLLYQKLLVNGSQPQSLFSSPPILLTGSMGDLANQYTILALNLALNQPLDLFQAKLGDDVQASGLFIQLVYSTQSVQYQIGQDAEASAKKAVFVMKDSQAFALRINEPYQGLYIMIHLPAEWCSQYVSPASLDLPVILPLSSRISYYLSEFFQDGKAKTPASMFHQPALLSPLVAQLLLELAERGKHPSDSQLIAHTKQNLIDHIHQKLPSIHVLADMVNVSTNTLKRKFQKYENQSLSEFYINEKMKVAIQKLAEQVSVKQIAIELGYANTANFINAFKRKFGMSPRKYNRKIDR